MSITEFRRRPGFAGSRCGFSPPPDQRPSNAFVEVRVREDPRVELATEPPGIEPLFRRTLAKFGGQAATKAIADSYLVAFAKAGGAHLVTFDRRLARAAQSRQIPTSLLKPQ